MEQLNSQWSQDLSVIEDEVEQTILKLIDHTGADEICFDIESPDLGYLTVTIKERRARESKQKTLAMNHYQTPSAPLSIVETKRIRISWFLPLFYILTLIVSVDIVIENDIDFEYIESAFYRINEAILSTVSDRLNVV